MKDIYAYNQIVKEMRAFFQEKKGFVEVPAQARQSILAACEDPATISQYIFSGINWPLPQTGQMWLEEELLKNPELPGVFCVTTSYRNEPNPVDGRHDKIFPMFEFESHGDVNDMIKLEEELLTHMGFGDSFHKITYDDAAKKYGVSLLDYEEEDALCKDFTTCTFLTDFPLRTDPFWNMKHAGNDLYSKVDVIVHGMETIGSAERATDKEEMRRQFHDISEGGYAKLLFNHFGEKRVVDELEAYLSHDFFPRYGGGIGVTRVARALELSNLLKKGG